jgi:hypothetical protein
MPLPPQALDAVCVCLNPPTSALQRFMLGLYSPSPRIRGNALRLYHSTPRRSYIARMLAVALPGMFSSESHPRGHPAPKETVMCALILNHTQGAIKIKEHIACLVQSRGG